MRKKNELFVRMGTTAHPRPRVVGPAPPAHLVTSWNVSWHPRLALVHLPCVVCSRNPLAARALHKSVRTWCAPHKSAHHLPLDVLEPPGACSGIPCLGSRWGTSLAWPGPSWWILWLPEPRTRGFGHDACLTRARTTCHMMGMLKKPTCQF